jgi:hypothetical protein
MHGRHGRAYRGVAREDVDARDEPAHDVEGLAVGQAAPNIIAQCECE